MSSERIIGVFVLIGGALMYLLLIPFGIDSPRDIEHLALAPEFWPKIVTGIVVLMGLLLVIKPAQQPDDASQDAVHDPETADDHSQSQLHRHLRVGFVLLVLFSFYFAIPYLGMVAGGTLVAAILMLFAGERRPHVVLLVAILVPLLLYGFFVYIAQIPIPLGVFETLRG